MDATSGAETAYPSRSPEFTPIFLWGLGTPVRVTRSLVLCICFVDRCLSFWFWPLSCLSFLDLRILITPLVSSNSSLPHLQLLSEYLNKMKCFDLRQIFDSQWSCQIISSKTKVACVHVQCNYQCLQSNKSYGGENIKLSYFQKHQFKSENRSPKINKFVYIFAYKASISFYIRIPIYHHWLYGICIAIYVRYSVINRETKWIILIYFFFKFNWIFHCR
jgi:hypothetical protein